jgi:translocation and assembly module TamA
MPPAPVRRLLGLIFALVLAGDAVALELKKVELSGIDAQLAANVRARLSIDRLLPEQRANVSEARLAFLLRQAPGEALLGLEPYGYYDAEVTPEVVRDGEQVTVRLAIKLGDPVRVRSLSLLMNGTARDDAEVSARIATFRPLPGDPFHHAVYEGSKSSIARVLADRGYFDAELEAHRVEVTRAERAADIDLAWDSGPRYSLGAVTFEGQQLRPGVLDPLVPWQLGAPYDNVRLLELQKSLEDTDFFSAISMLPEPDQAVDGQVPIKVLLVPGRRSVYNLGLRYGTDSGAGVVAGLERRWVNDRGHKLLLDTNLAQYNSLVTVQYRVPAFGWLDGWYSFGATARERVIDEVTSQYIDVFATRSGRLRGWNLLAGLNFKRERSDSLDSDQFNYVNLVYPSLWGQWRQADDANTPQRGRALTMTVRGGSTAVGSDVSFLQLSVAAQYIRGLGSNNRLLLRSELGATSSDDFALLPPSMRFFAGGDRSVRGYSYEEIGVDNGTNVVGGKYLAVASVEFEHMFTPVWGAAAFVDAGDAFDQDMDIQYGIGAGLRWRSPVGPVRVDIAHGVGDANQNVRLHISIGPDL